MKVKSWITGTRAVSLPFSDFCQPLFKEKNYFNVLFDKVKQKAKSESWEFIELKSAENFIEEEENFLVEYHHLLKLSNDTEKLFSSFSSNTRRNIKKAEREDIQIIKSNSSDSLDAFYKLNTITRKKHGLPPQPITFFRNLYKYILSKDLGFIVNASYRNRIIASAVYLLFGNKALYKFGASDLNYQNLRANNLVMWKAISWCAENGYEEFSFGKTESENDGLRRFKNGWNTEEQVLKTFRFNIESGKFNAIKSKTTGFHTKVFARLPVQISTLIGRMAYRHIG